MSDIEFEKLYRPSATVIVASLDPEIKVGFDYKILLAKRTVQTAFAPNHHVFPGGVFDPVADEDPQWLQLFYDFKVTPKKLKQLNLEHLVNRPRPIMTNGRHFSRDISLRITAIRETFEEVGLLLCLSRDQLTMPHKGSGTFRCNFDRAYWQERVHNNPKEFLSLCRRLDVVPDIWSLHEWSIWRSPATSTKKYDTAIYIVFLEKQPSLLLEPSEVEKELWTTPSLALEKFNDRYIWLPPMQFYEISRLASNLCWGKLKDITLQRSKLGCTLLMMAYYRCNDTLVGTLPYDDFYPENPLDHRETIKLQEACSEFEAKAKNLHRLIWSDMYKMKIVCNLATADGHTNILTSKL